MKVFVLDNGCNLTNYVNALKECKCKVVFSKNIDKSKRCDALVLTGGGDVLPYFYGKNKSITDNVDVNLDILEFTLIKNFVEKGKKILGICKGMQILNVYFGGTLQKNIPFHYNKNYDLYHTIKIETPCFLNQLFSNKIIVNSAHKQAVKNLGENLSVLAKSNDDIIEVIKHNTLPIIATQFHPERLAENFRKPFFDYFINKL